MTSLTPQAVAAREETLPPCLLRLELNNSGAWKCLARYNYNDLKAAKSVQDIGLALVAMDPSGKTTLRLSIDGSLPQTLAYCRHDTGWEWKTAMVGTS